MFERLSTEINILSANIEAKMSPNASHTSNSTVSLNSSKNSTKYPVVPVSPKVLPTATLVQTVNEDIKLHQPVIDSVKVTTFVQSEESSVSTIVPA
ncbi:unnamed protein product [Hymenolepis diminuta]|uniref:Uncharacterized protein n=1 Tax=Hymenolepis diminuta TaxID=6216 RepID=A0A564YXU1_HYMDI|nr:unnamed protein product [Hymenolepis diminuta]